MKAVIMAGGLGTRLRPLTFTRPKPVMPVANKPIICHVADLLKKTGFKKTIVTLWYGGEAITRCLKEVEGLEITFSIEEKPLGTAGGVGRIREKLTDTFLVISGDLVTDIDLASVVKLHVEKGGLATMVLTPVPDTRHYGIAELDSEQRIVKFLEKPRPEEAFSKLANAGIYVLEPEVFKYIPEGKMIDFSRDVFPQMLGRGEEIYGFIYEGYWNDVGTLDTYIKANMDALDGKVHLDLSAELRGNGLWIAKDAMIEDEVYMEPPLLIGGGAKVERGARLYSYTVIGSNTVVKRRAKLERAIVLEEAEIGEEAKIKDAVVGARCKIGNKAFLERSVLGDEASVGEGAQVAPKMVRVAPFLSIAPHSNIYSDYMAP